MNPKSYDSVWDAIEDDGVEAANLKLRSQLMMEISTYVKASGLTQAEAAKKLATTQPRLNDVLKGKIEKCTVDRLVNMLTTVGYEVNLRIKKSNAVIPRSSRPSWSSLAEKKKADSNLLSQRVDVVSDEGRIK